MEILTLFDLVIRMHDSSRRNRSVDRDRCDSVDADRSGRNRLHHWGRDSLRSRRLGHRVLLVLGGHFVDLFFHLLVIENLVLNKMIE